MTRMETSLESNEPLVWTSKGNLPVASLGYETKWYDTPEYTKFVEIYKLGDEIVKESAHVMAKRGFFSESIAQPLT